MQLRALLSSAGLLLGLAGLGVADFMLVERPMQTVQEPGDIGGASSSSMSSASSADASSSAEGVVKGVSRNAGPAVKEVLMERGYTWTDLSETALLETVLGSTDVQKIALLRNEDRAAGLAWIDVPDAKEVLFALKQAMLQNFSGNVTDVVDETRRPADAAPHDILSFRDPAIGPERLLFVRVRTRLYEFHIREGFEPEIDALVLELAR